MAGCGASLFGNSSQFIKINGGDLVTQGQAEVKEVEEEIKGQSNSSFFFMVKK